MLRLQNERMKGALLPSPGEFFKHYGLTPEKLALANPDAIVMHPGPMNRGVEIDSAVADGARIGDPAAGHVRHRGADGGDEHPRRKLTMRIEIRNGRIIDPKNGVDRDGSRSTLLARQHRRASAVAPADWQANRMHRRRRAGRRAGPRRSRRPAARARVSSTRRRSSPRCRRRSPAASRASPVRPTPTRRSTSRGSSRC